ncbi:hypothetical protein T12_2253, partial [Trichinella patagoniensis]
LERVKMNDILFIHLIYIYINDDEASGLWNVAEYGNLTIMLLCFYRLQSCASALRATTNLKFIAMGCVNAMEPFHALWGNQTTIREGYA